MSVSDIASTRPPCKVCGVGQCVVICIMLVGLVRRVCVCVCVWAGVGQWGGLETLANVLRPCV